MSTKSTISIKHRSLNISNFFFLFFSVTRLLNYFKMRSEKYVIFYHDPVNLTTHIDSLHDSVRCKREYTFWQTYFRPNVAKFQQVSKSFVRNAHVSSSICTVDCCEPILPFLVSFGTWHSSEHRKCVVFLTFLKDWISSIINRFFNSIEFI